LGQLRFLSFRRGELRPRHLTNRWSQPLAAAMTSFNFMEQSFVFATFAPASGGSASSR
jgi:hypothetical protein